MKKILSKRINKVGFSFLVFSVSFIVFHFTALNELHGRSDAPIIIGLIGVIALIIAYIFDLNMMIIASTFGYALGAILGVVFESEGMIFNNEPIHSMWIFWLVSYFIIIFLGLAADFLVKILSNRSKLNYIGLFSTIVVLIFSVYSYVTRPLSVNDVFQHKPWFYGVVEEVNDDSMLIRVDENCFVAKSGDMINVSLNVLMSDLSVSKNDFLVGDIVSTYFDGNVLESDPLLASNVYIISNTNTTIAEDGIEKGSSIYPYEEISVLTGLPINSLKDQVEKNHDQFVIDFLNRLRNPLTYDGGDGNHYTFDEMADILGGKRHEHYDSYIADTDKFLEDFKRVISK